MIPELGILLVVLLAFAFVAYVIACTMSGRYEPIILLWALLAPLGYCLLAYPLDRPVITLHRIVIVPVAVLVFILPSASIGRINSKLSRLAICWLLFALGAMLSLINAPRSLWLSATRVTIDSFLLPLLLAFLIYRCFRVKEHLPWLHIVVCVVSLYLAITGGLEIFTGRALMPQPGAADVLYAGGGLFEIVRPTGPYANPATLSLVGMINLFLLMFFRRAMGTLPPWNSLLHWPGIVASLLVSVMTFTRGVLIAFALIILIETGRSKTAKQRGLRIAGALGLLALFCAAIMFAPSQVKQERTSQDNLWGRVAQQAQTFQVFWNHPLTGVGLCNFGTVATSTSDYKTSFQGSDAVDGPHNLLGEIISETGLVGALPFIGAQVLLIATFRQLRSSREASARLTWTYFIMIFTAYWALNMDFGIGYYSELNLWFVFAITLMYRYAAEMRCREIRVPMVRVCSPRVVVPPTLRLPC